MGRGMGDRMLERQGREPERKKYNEALVGLSVQLITRPFSRPGPLQDPHQRTQSSSMQVALPR